MQFAKTPEVRRMLNKAKKLLLWTPPSTIFRRTRPTPFSSSSTSLFLATHNTFSSSSSSLNNIRENSFGFSLIHKTNHSRRENHPNSFNGQRRSLCSETPHKCWNCNVVAETVPFLFCHSCRSIQPFDPSIDYFQIFGLEKKYELEDVNLEGKYKDWQKKLHPDLVHSKSEQERDYAAQQSARVIDAYRTLSKPLPRAIYILKLVGVNVDQEETISEPGLLAEVMEIREAVEDAPDSQALKQIQSQVQGKLKHWSDSFAKAFQNQKFEEAITAIRRMTYYDRINEEIVRRF